MAGTDEVITLEEAKRQVALVCRRLGLLHLSFAEVLVKELGREKGEKLVARAIKEYGKKIGEKKREVAIGKGLEPGAESFGKVGDIPSIGMHERSERAQVEGETRTRMYGCVMGKVFHDLGEDDLGRLYCLVDPANSMAFDPGIKMVHTKAMPDGDEFCELVTRPTTEKDRREYRKKDPDWKSIEQG